MDLHRATIAFLLLAILACEADSPAPGLYVEPANPSTTDYASGTPAIPTPQANDTDVLDSSLDPEEPTGEEGAPIYPMESDATEGPPCSGCLEGAESCEEVCLASGYGAGHCAHPDSIDPTACCDCTDPLDAPEEDIPFDVDDVVWLHTDVSDWDVTSTVTSAHINYNELCVYHTKAGQWPEIYGIFPEEPEAPMEGNIWIIASIEGIWYAATFDYLRPGDECKFDGYSPEDEGPGPSTFGAVPLSTWVPQPGELVYVFMSTVARHEPLGPLQERSDIVPLIWP